MAAVNTVFCLVYAAAAQRHGIVASFAAAFTTWIVLALLAGSLIWTFADVIMLSLVTFGVCVPLAERFCRDTTPSREALLVRRPGARFAGLNPCGRGWRHEREGRAGTLRQSRPVPDCAVEHGPHLASSHRWSGNGCSDGVRRLCNRVGITTPDSCCWAQRQHSASHCW